MVHSSDLRNSLCYCTDTNDHSSRYNESLCITNCEFMRRTESFDCSKCNSIACSTYQ